MSHPFSGISILDLTQIYNGPYATFLLSQAGADVIKVEPIDGEHFRDFPAMDLTVQAMTGAIDTTCYPACHR